MDRGHLKIPPLGFADVPLTGFAQNWAALSGRSAEFRERLSLPMGVCLVGTIGYRRANTITQLSDKPNMMLFVREPTSRRTPPAGSCRDRPRDRVRRWRKDLLSAPWMRRPGTTVPNGTAAPAAGSRQAVWPGSTCFGVFLSR